MTHRTSEAQPDLVQARLLLRRAFDCEHAEDMCNYIDLALLKLRRESPRAKHLLQLVWRLNAYTEHPDGRLPSYVPNDLWKALHEHAEVLMYTPCASNAAENREATLAAQGFEPVPDAAKDPFVRPMTTSTRTSAVDELTQEAEKLGMYAPPASSGYASDHERAMAWLRSVYPHLYDLEGDGDGLRTDAHMLADHFEAVRAEEREACLAALDAAYNRERLHEATPSRVTIAIREAIEERSAHARTPEDK